MKYTVTDACSLVAATDFAKAINVDSTLVQSGGGNGVPGACFYNANDPKTQTEFSLFIFAQAYPDASAADAVQPDQMAAAYKAIFGISSAKKVDGIGDKAFEYAATEASSGGTGVAIFVFKANVLMFLVLSPTSDSTGIESLAKTAVGNLHS